MSARGPQPQARATHRSPSLGRAAEGKGASSREVERLATRLPIAEMFTSIQGEGRLTGVPSFFIRISGCNLRCVWCDTPYASWNPEGDQHTVDDLIERARTSGVGHIVLTGGEPMIFDGIEPLTARLRDHGLHITIETAGTVYREVPCDLMSISPKLANSTPGSEHGEWSKRHESRRIKVGVLQRLIDRYPGRQLKFVVASRGDLSEIDQLLSQLSGFSKDDILLMPEGVEAGESPRKRLVAQLCIERGWRYCPRLHIELFGHVRGT